MTTAPLIYNEFYSEDPDVTYMWHRYYHFNLPLNINLVDLIYDKSDSPPLR
jgi:hypothetical protein